MRKLLYPLSVLYFIVISIRNYLYNKGIFKAYPVPPLVVSVGNIEAGGTGKTPFTIALAEVLHQKGYRTVIVTRGYKGKLKGTVKVEKNHSHEDVGDEALLMAKLSPVPVIKSPDRVKGALYAKQTLDAEIIILDDGFQHRRIFRDMDIVLIGRDIEHEHLLPVGNLREPKSSLKRADFVIYTKSVKGHKDSASFVIDGLVGVDGQKKDLLYLKDKSVVAFCGIARPEFFFEEIKQIAAKVEMLTYSDHHSYTRHDIEAIKQSAKSKDLIVTTEKDMVRLDKRLLDDTWYALKGKMIVPQIDKIVERIEALAEDRRISRQG
jgi:tetraacyldisaccharide 4'-kinase